MTADPSWVEHYCDERDAAFLYRALAAVESDEARRTLFDRLAKVEDRHVHRWEALFAEHAQPIPRYRLSWRARMLAWMARRFGADMVLPLLLAEEGREVTAYLRLAHGAGDSPVHDAAFEIATESAEHARELSGLLGREGEPWHAGGGGGYLRSVVYGFNDGLTANFGLVAGVIGAGVSPTVVIITGVAGAIADALSMGASGYLAAKSAAEVHAHQIEMERHELQLMPEVEEEELALIYEVKGFTAEKAKETAKIMMRDPVKALEVKVREELQLTEAELTPAIDGWVTGSATAVGALIPIAPFLLLEADAAIWVSLFVSMSAHFAIGAARSLFTGRSVWASGRDMFVVGFGVAAVGYLIGEAITRIL